MLRLPTVILKHATRTGTHYDLMIAPPTNAPSPLPVPHPLSDTPNALAPTTTRHTSTPHHTPHTPHAPHSPHSPQAPHDPHHPHSPQSPHASLASLWTVRISHPPAHWRPHTSLKLHPLPLHRHHYLTYQGPISGGRGHVIRVDHGHALLQHRSTHTAILDIAWQISHTRHRLKLTLTDAISNAVILS